jgi:hypothetical protein
MAFPYAGKNLYDLVSAAISFVLALFALIRSIIS